MDPEANKRICAFEERYSCNLQAIKVGYTAIQNAGGWARAAIKKANQAIDQRQ